jgi:hypothetical protein
VLKADGVAVLYFGRKWLFSNNRTSRLLYRLDRILEKFLLPKGYAELPARVNETNLLVGLHHAQGVAEKLGFVVAESLVSRKAAPNGSPTYGGQNGMVLLKKAGSSARQPGS